MLFDNDLTFLSFVNIEEESEKDEKHEVYTSSEGFVKGNIFESEYKPYKNYKTFMPKTTSEKSAMLYKIMELQFAINDLNLYLDLHPQNKKIFKTSKEYIKELLELENVYVEKYGPLEITENIYKKNMWVSSWPWEKEDSVYV